MCHRGNAVLGHLLCGGRHRDKTVFIDLLFKASSGILFRSMVPLESAGESYWGSHKPEQQDKEWLRELDLDSLEDRRKRGLYKVFSGNYKGDPATLFK